MGVQRVGRRTQQSWHIPSRLESHHWIQIDQEKWMSLTICTTFLHKVKNKTLRLHHSTSSPVGMGACLQSVLEYIPSHCLVDFPSFQRALMITWWHFSSYLKTRRVQHWLGSLLRQCPTQMTQKISSTRNLMPLTGYESDKGHLWCLCQGNHTVWGPNKVSKT